MDSGSFFAIFLMFVVSCAILYGVVRAAVVKGMKEYYEEKTFLDSKSKKDVDLSDLK